MNVSNHVLVISHDVVGAQMAGPGIRYFHLAQALSREFPVVLAIPAPARQSASANFSIVEYARGDWHALAPWVRNARAIILPSDIASDLPELAECKIPLVIDGYDPLLAEWITLAEPLDAAAQEKFWYTRMAELNQQYVVGDFFICASERQRDWWLGLLEANGRVNPWTFAEDASLRRLIDVVPFGLPATLPTHTRAVIKQVWRGIGARDRVILWGGGLWQWLDPLTAIRAVAQIWQTRQDVRLIFPGTRHPNPILSGIPTHDRAARALADELGLLDQAIFFGDWIAYDDWQNVLLESDLALTLHQADTLESRLAFRSRVLEYIWAGVPIIASRGDATSELVDQYQLGLTVACGDGDAVARAILILLDTPRENFVERFAQARSRLTWERAVEPLAKFCRAPRIAPDKRVLSQPWHANALAQLRAECVRLRADNAQRELEIARVRAENDQRQSEIAQVRADNAQRELEIAHWRAEQERVTVDLAHEQVEHARARRDLAQLTELVHTYQRRKVVRALNWLSEIAQRFRGG